MSSVWRTRHEGELPTLTVGGPIPAAIQRILHNRGLTEAQKIESFLYPKLQNLKDPLLMKDMDRAVQRLLRAHKNQERIAIYADFDLDGTSGLALLIHGLTHLGFNNLVPYQPARLSEGYGFHLEAVEALAKEHVTLILTVDVGITALEATAGGVAHGIDVIITDHHLPGEILPSAYAVVNPNQSGDTSGLGYLSGAGVAFYLLRALKRELVRSGVTLAAAFDLKDVLEYFAIATLTDMVPLVEDNRVLVRHGLLKMAETDKPGLRALMGAVGLEGRALTSQDVAIKLAPKLNALSRMGSEILPIDILLCEDARRAHQLMAQVLQNNQMRVQLQGEAEAEIQDFLATARGNDYLFLVSPRFHRGLVGLLATKMAGDGLKPSFVGSLDEKTGIVVGSARRPASFDGCLVEILSSAKEHLKRFGGHSQAAGFEFSFENWPQIKEAFDRFFQNQNFESKPREYYYDTELDFSEVTPQFMKWLEFLGPFGAQFEAPLFCFKSVKLQSLRELKGGHLKLTCLSTVGPFVQEALLFSPSRVQRELLAERTMSYDLLGELQWNYFNGKQSVQLLIKDLRVSLWQ